VNTKELIPRSRSIIPACDVSDTKELDHLIEQTHDVPGIGGYKVGLELTISYGLKPIVDIIRKYTELPIIYDHQKGGTDIPELGSRFAKVCRSAGVNAVILFPFGGSETEKEWIKACQDAELTVLVGGHMTQKKFLVSEGGFIDDRAPQKIYEIAVESGVTDFVVPGNKPELVIEYKKFFESKGISFVLYAPGFIAQGGVITECGKVAGARWHAIVGSAIYRAKDIREASKILTQKLYTQW
jgi:orotidine-5'-phosphate decarboxylase